jgi:hypothetical protein
VVADLEVNIAGRSGGDDVVVEARLVLVAGARRVAEERLEFGAGQRDVVSRIEPIAESRGSAGATRREVAAEVERPFFSRGVPGGDAGVFHDLGDR